MATLDELKKKWNTDAPSLSASAPYDQAGLLAITRARSARQVNRTIRYFWASLTLQIIVYGLLSHLFIRFWGVSTVQWLCLAGVLLYLPFTIVLMRQFKRVALASPVQTDTDVSVQARIQQQYNSLTAFYRFKRSYEYVLVPLSTALGVWLTFMLFVPGGVLQHPAGAAVTYLLSLLSCVWAIRQENHNQFKQPLQNLEKILNEFNQ
ncbi:hypothetical protein GCM10027341_43060 [Spirosoma knui]